MNNLKREKESDKEQSYKKSETLNGSEIKQHC